MIFFYPWGLALAFTKSLFFMLHLVIGRPSGVQLLHKYGIVKAFSVRKCVTHSLCNLYDTYVYYISMGLLRRCQYVNV